MSAARLALLATALAATAAFAQADRDGDAQPAYAERTYLSEPRDAPMPPYPMSAHQAEAMYGYPYAYVYGDRAPAPASADVAARRDSNPDDFATGIYNPKP